MLKTNKIHSSDKQANNLKSRILLALTSSGTSIYSIRNVFRKHILKWLWQKKKCQ